MQIRDKVFPVTGASSGLGAATARLLAESGARVVLADLKREAGEALADELGGVAHFVATDVTSEEGAINAVRTAVSAFGGLHGLVNCAGVAPAEVRASLGPMVPFPPRLGKPPEFAGLVKHIAENSYLNGEVIRLDGALRMGAK